MKGKVKFYNKEKKFGFISGNNGKDIHFSADSFDGLPPSEGDEVEFEVVKQAKGLHAVKIKKIEKNLEKNFKLPYDTGLLLQQYSDIDNFNLKMNKTAKFDEQNKKFIFFKTDKGEIIYKINFSVSKEFNNNISENYYVDIEKLGYWLKFITLKPNWRLVVGLGNPSVYEVSMTLHHIYGIPYIPGSAIKGVVRNYIISEEFEGDEDKALQDEKFCLVFGSPKKSRIGEHKGRVIFFDAFPLDFPQIEPDVMNVHYPYYYREKMPPADYQNPNPVYFYTVKNTKFKFAIGIKRRDIDKIKEGKKIFASQSILEYTLKNLINALSEYGIGAKTSVGYGLMEQD